MKKAYNKLATDELIIETEGSFMQCSVRVEAEMHVEDYHEHTFESTSSKEWEIGF